MSLTTKNQLLIAFKKLVGKAHTNSQFGSVNESVGTNVQIDSSTIFSQQIPNSPSSSLYSITNNVVEKIKFNLVSIPLSQYTANGVAGGGITADGDGAPTQGTFSNGIHAFALTLPGDYEVSSSNSKKGTGVFINGQSLTGSNGVLQIVAERYGSSYAPSVSSSSGIIAALDEENYVLDPYSGILFLQDINRVPTSVTAYVYIGDFLEKTIQDISSSVTSSSQILQKTYISSSVAISSSQRVVFATNNLDSNLSITLPSVALADSSEYYIIKSDSLTGSVFVSGNLTDTINGQNVYELNGPYQSITLINDGTGSWYVF
jgi:hypothetical protein